MKANSYCSYLKKSYYILILYAARPSSGRKIDIFISVSVLNHLILIPEQLMDLLPRLLIRQSQRSCVYSGFSTTFTIPPNAELALESSVKRALYMLFVFLLFRSYRRTRSLFSELNSFEHLLKLSLSFSLLHFKKSQDSSKSRTFIRMVVISLSMGSTCAASYI